MLREKQKSIFLQTVKETAAVLRRIAANLKEENYSALGPDAVEFKRLAARLGEMLAPSARGYTHPVKAMEKID